MPILKGPIQFTGSMDELVAYTTKDSDKVILRRKAFISKEAYQKEPQYAAMRYNSAEFKGCAYAGKMLRKALWPVIQLADYNMTPALNSFCKALQKRDTVGRWGERSIRFSAFKDALTSLQFTKRHLFESVCKQRPVAELIRDKAELHIHFGDLLPGFNFYQPWDKPYFRIIAHCCAIEDVHYTNNGYDNEHTVLQQPTETVFSDWMISAKKMPAQSLIIKLRQPELVQQETTTLLGAVGIQMGQPDMLGEINPVKYASTARILTTC